MVWGREKRWRCDTDEPMLLMLLACAAPLPPDCENDTETACFTGVYRTLLGGRVEGVLTCRLELAGTGGAPSGTPPDTLGGGGRRNREQQFVELRIDRLDLRLQPRLSAPTRDRKCTQLKCTGGSAAEKLANQVATHRAFPDVALAGSAVQARDSECGGPSAALSQAKATSICPAPELIARACTKW